MIKIASCKQQCPLSSLLELFSSSLLWRYQITFLNTTLPHCLDHCPWLYFINNLEKWWFWLTLLSVFFFFFVLGFIEEIFIQNEFKNIYLTFWKWKLFRCEFKTICFWNLTTPCEFFRKCITCSFVNENEIGAGIW